MLIALKILACTTIASFGISTMAQNDFAERTASAVFVFASLITAIISILL